MNRMIPLVLALVCLFTVTGFVNAKEQRLNLLDTTKPAMGWSLGLGPEFPGAKGTLEAVPLPRKTEPTALKLHGDFSDGGNYVQASRSIGKINPRMLSFRILSPRKKTVTLRLVDSAGTCHQIRYKITPTDQWQRINFPIASFFKNMGTPDAVAGVVKYERWGKSAKKEWTPPLNSLHVLVGRDKSGAEKFSTLWLSDVYLTGSGPETRQNQIDITETIRLDETVNAGVADWKYWHVGKFPKGKFGVKLVSPAPDLEGKNAIRFFTDFSDKGNYAVADRSFSDISVSEIRRLNMKVRTENVSAVTVRVTDRTGQVHQRKNIRLKPDGAWHDFVIDPKRIAGGERWGGANDGKLHQPIRSASIAFNRKSAAESPTPELLIADITADVVKAGQVPAPTFTETFEANDAGGNWKHEGDVAISEGQAFKGKRAYRMTRTLTNINTPTRATSRTFTAAPGKWNLTGAFRSEIHSPDNSYHGRVDVDWLDGGGKRIGSSTALIGMNQPAWQSFSKRVEAPAGTAQGRFRLSLAKTYGWVEVDNLKAAQIAVAASEPQRIERINFKTAAKGNLFLPDQPIDVTIKVQARMPLKPEQRKVVWQVRDFWGAIHASGDLVLTDAGPKSARFHYETKIDLNDANLIVSKFYELHVTVNADGEQPISDFRGIARLPIAETKKYRPEQIPFSIRNWDSRITEYFYLADRIGIREVGMWGRWPAKNPKKVQLGGFKLLEKLDMRGIVGLPGSFVERGKFEYTDQVLREGMTELMAKFNGPYIGRLALGNEPHGGIEQIRKNVAAYKSLYEAAKQADPDIFIIATSVGPDRRYFDEGYHNYCDAYDFHTYGSYQGIPKLIERYRALMNEYGAPKPIYCTEFGLNSQGMSRHAVANEMIKKFSVFFAAGGAHASWFTIMYPDKKGKARGTFGDAHCVFDCKFNEYNPRLDAISLYHITNGICIKKFTAKRMDDDKTQAYLFVDEENRCLQTIWNETGRYDVHVPTPGAQVVRAIGIDGREMPLQVVDGGVTITVSPEPVMLMYQSTTHTLDGAVAPGKLQAEGTVTPVVKGRSTTVRLTGALAKADALRITAPLHWKATTKQQGNAVLLSIHAPTNTPARAARVVVQPQMQAQPVGKLILTVPVTDSAEIQLLPGAQTSSQPGSVILQITNHETNEMTLDWALAINKQHDMKKGQYSLTAGEAPTTHFASAASGQVQLASHQTKQIAVPLARLEPLSLYRIQGSVTSMSGRTVTTERLMGGFARAPRATNTITLDGKLDEPVWQRASVGLINAERQSYVLKQAKEDQGWDGPADSSGKLRFAWDAENFYVAMEVTDDVFSAPHSHSGLWKQDGLQFLIDPMRTSAQKPGKYDYSLGLGSKGPQATRHLTADQSIPTGEAKDVKVSVRRLDNTTGNVVYEVAFPWHTLSPFKPGVGANLGVSCIINEDDGTGRGGFMGWFSGVHSKQLDMLGDVVLTK